jgi:hypothetical protein
MIPLEYQTHGTTSPTLLRSGGRRDSMSVRRPHACICHSPTLSRQIHDLEEEVGTQLFLCKLGAFDERGNKVRLGLSVDHST